MDSDEDRGELLHDIAVRFGPEFLFSGNDNAVRGVLKDFRLEKRDVELLSSILSKFGQRIYESIIADEPRAMSDVAGMISSETYWPKDVISSVMDDLYYAVTSRTVDGSEGSETIDATVRTVPAEASRCFLCGKETDYRRTSGRVYCRDCMTVIGYGLGKSPADEDIDRKADQLASGKTANKRQPRRKCSICGRETVLSVRDGPCCRNCMPPLFKGSPWSWSLDDVRAVNEHRCDITDPSHNIGKCFVCGTVTDSELKDGFCCRSCLPKRMKKPVETYSVIQIKNRLGLRGKCAVCGKYTESKITDGFCCDICYIYMDGADRSSVRAEDVRIAAGIVGRCVVCERVTDKKLGGDFCCEDCTREIESSLNAPPLVGTCFLCGNSTDIMLVDGFCCRDCLPDSIGSPEIWTKKEIRHMLTKSGRLEKKSLFSRLFGRR